MMVDVKLKYGDVDYKIVGIWGAMVVKKFAHTKRKGKISGEKKQVAHSYHHNIARCAEYIMRDVSLKQMKCKKLDDVIANEKKLIKLVEELRELCIETRKDDDE